jgi:hypothetical protein
MQGTAGGRGDELLAFSCVGYPLYSTCPNSWWFHKGSIRLRADLHSLLNQTIEQLAPRGRGSAVEPEGELVEVVVS